MYSVAKRVERSIRVRKVGIRTPQYLSEVQARHRDIVLYMFIEQKPLKVFS